MKNFRLISMNKGCVAIVDIANYELLSKYSWVVHNKGGYPATNINGKTTLMHHLIMKAPNKMETDHIDGNPLDNRKCNLRFVTKAQNQMNSKSRKNSTSKYKGVSWDKKRSKWRCVLMKSYKQIWIGHFKKEIDAALAYNEAAKKYFGEFARLNEVSIAH